MIVAKCACALYGLTLRGFFSKVSIVDLLHSSLSFTHVDCRQRHVVALGVERGFGCAPGFQPKLLEVVTLMHVGIEGIQQLRYYCYVPALDACRQPRGVWPTYICACTTQ